MQEIIEGLREATYLPVTLILLIYFSIISYTDLKHRKIFDKVNLGLIAFRLVFHYYGYPINSSQIIAALIGFLLFFGVGFWLGIPMGGDIKAVFSVGLYYKLLPFLTLIMVSLIASFIYYYFFLKEKDLNMAIDVQYSKKHIPFGFCLGLSFVIVQIFARVYGGM